jgi:hypothetical protein
MGMDDIVFVPAKSAKDSHRRHGVYFASHPHGKGLDAFLKRSMINAAFVLADKVGYMPPSFQTLYQIQHLLLTAAPRCFRVDMKGLHVAALPSVEARSFFIIVTCL